MSQPYSCWLCDIYVISFVYFTMINMNVTGLLMFMDINTELQI